MEYDHNNENHEDKNSLITGGQPSTDQSNTVILLYDGYFEDDPYTSMSCSGFYDPELNAVITADHCIQNEAYLPSVMIPKSTDIKDGYTQIVAPIGKQQMRDEQGIPIDAAVLYLPDEVRGTISMPSLEYARPDENFDYYLAKGWGLEYKFNDLTEGPLSNRLKEVKLSKVSEDQPEEQRNSQQAKHQTLQLEGEPILVRPEGYPEQVTVNDTCDGDSGGIVLGVVDNPSSSEKEYKVVGVISQGSQICGDGTEPSKNVIISEQNLNSIRDNRAIYYQNLTTDNNESFDFFELTRTLDHLLMGSLFEDLLGVNRT